MLNGSSFYNLSDGTHKSSSSSPVTGTSTYTTSQYTHTNQKSQKLDFPILPGCYRAASRQAGLGLFFYAATYSITVVYLQSSKRPYYARSLPRTLFTVEGGALRFAHLRTPHHSAPTPPPPFSRGARMCRHGRPGLASFTQAHTCSHTPSFFNSLTRPFCFRARARGDPSTSR